MGALDPHARPPVVLPDGTWRFAARIVRWTDGDTAVVDCVLDVGFEEMGTKRRRIRLAGVDAPETRSADPAEREAGRAALAYMLAHWPAGTPLVVDVIRWDKYGGRDLGALVDAAGIDLAGALLEAGHGVVYDGGAR